MFPKPVLKAAITTHGDADVRSDRNAGNDVRVRTDARDDRVHLTPPRRLCWSPAFLDCGGAVRYLKRPQLADESFVASHPPRGQPTSVGLSEEPKKDSGGSEVARTGSRSRGRRGMPAFSSEFEQHSYVRLRTTIVAGRFGCFRKKFDNWQDLLREKTQTPDAHFP
jgi:hypothetical protein